MVDANTLLSSHDETYVGRHRFIIFIAGAVIIALLLTWISMSLYNSSGAAQVDLSRPGYDSVRSQVTDSTTFEAYPASGKIDKQAIDQFRTLYAEQAKKATAVDSFGGNVLDDASLQIDDPAQANTNTP